MNRDNFKLCPGCHKWLTLDDVLTNGEIKPLGLTLAGEECETSWFYFQHNVSGCHSSFVVPADWFRSVIDEPIPSEVRTGTEGCEGRCLHIEDWAACGNDCRHAPFRRLLIRMAECRNIPVNSSASEKSSTLCSRGEVNR